MRCIPLAVHVGLHGRVSAHSTFVDIGPSTHRMDACVGPFPLKSDLSECAANTAAIWENLFFGLRVGRGGRGAKGAGGWGVDA
jgi:hypothetical protein